MNTPTRVRVAISTPGRDPNAKSPGGFAVHVGHARTLYLASRIAQERGCPFDVRLDGSIEHFGGDLSRFVLDVEACLDFLGIQRRRVYWHRQRPYPASFLDKHFSSSAQALLDFISWEEWALDTLAILDDVEHAPSIIVRGKEFVDPEACVGRRSISRGMLWYKALERTLFELAQVQNLEINVPLITMDGYKLSKEEGRVIHWRVLEVLGREQACAFLDDSSKGGENWEWDWQVLARYRPDAEKERQAVLDAHRYGCERP